ncbi:MAG: polysaccharide deacetylase [Lachnospiraceae bacterium]|nr:polysaccharide deacetylase [Lachnospiraceae bacterium]
MVESNNLTAKSPKRQKRVKRLKRIIVGTFLTVTILPTVLCIFFAISRARYKAALKEKTEELNYYMELGSEAEFLEESIPEELSVEVVSTDRKPSVSREKLTGDDIKNLSLSDEELYDGYRKIYLTFDDGPSANTDAILDILKEYNVKATFFVVRHEGRNFERLYRRIVDEGHSLGMHSSTHVYSDLYSDRDAVMEDTESLRNFLYLVTGVESDIYRFPGGSTNRASSVDMHEFADALNEEGIVFFDWNVSSRDATAGGVSRDSIINNVTREIGKHSESIVLFHDLGSKVTTVEALPAIIEYINSMNDAVMLPITRETDPIQFLSVKEDN